jgi:polygalacturonase
VERAPDVTAAAPVEPAAVSPATAAAAPTPAAALRTASGQLLAWTAVADKPRAAITATPAGILGSILKIFGIPSPPHLPPPPPLMSFVLEWARRTFNASAPTSATSAQPELSSTTTAINVKDYGAVGDGVTDDSAAIKAAESALTSGERLYFPEGDYRFAQQNPAGNAAILLNGLSDVTVEFAPGARLLMDNLDASGLGTSYGIRVVGSASGVTILNPTIEWTTRPSARSFGDGISVLGWPSDSPPPVGWTGSTGEVQNISIINARVVNSPQAGVVVMGASDVTVTDLTVIGSLADGLHFNANRRVTVDGLYAENTGDDGLAFVTYYDPAQVWTYGPTDGPFNGSGLGEWNNSDSTATTITVNGGQASGVRVQGSYDISISHVTVTGKDFGIQVNSSISTGPGDWTSLASRDISISDVTIDDTTTGIVLGTHNIDGTEDPMWWDFSGLDISDVTITNSDNWSIAVETPATETSKFAGVTLRDIYAESNGTPSGGGNGGMLLASLQDSTIDNVKLVSDHDASIYLLGANQIRGGLSVDELPSSNLGVDDLALEGAGRILIQDIAGVTFGDVTSSYADGAGIELYRVKDASFDTLTAYLPGRGNGAGYGVRLLQVDGIDIANVVVTTDDHVGSSFWSLELGGGNPTQDIAGTDVHVEHVSYVSDVADMGSPIVVQGGPYGPVNWYINASWLYQGDANPQWSSATYGDISPL